MYVFGNGESRSGVDISSLYGTKVGCNAIMRDFDVDHLVCVDKRMVEEALEHKINTNTKVYTRYDWFPRYKKYKNIRQLPELPYKGNERWDEPFQWGSGPYAVLVAAQKAKDETVHLIGFDMYSNTPTVNNVYKDSKNYDRADKRAVDPRYWIHQISKVFESYPKKQFVIYNIHSKLQETWNYPNVSLDTLNNL
ncbi:hypothetical protein N9C48_01030 [bacterium]|nr:hypothetical protein [bacterium]